MIYQRLTKSQRKFIRKGKARIRRQILDSKKQEEMIQKLYERFNKKVPVKAVAIKVKKKSSPQPTVASKDQ